ncbi:MAG: HNH endonuclease [Shewanella sp.]|uniref:HNH endonuclease n=3 Tax=Aeromonas veronii TaxID=654 RepID=UPI001F2CC4D3|nr:HNH endonuclease [Aeromonas veronii]MCF5910532.1 HNH endonuclease [Aeromonas veronii]
MIENKICPYCGKEMIKAENQDNSRSVEHLIPNAVLIKKRDKSQGDFYACRKCNTKKSKVDELIGIVTKIQSYDSMLAIESASKLVQKTNYPSRRYVKMIQSRDIKYKYVEFDMPFSGEEIIEYLIFLGKGLFFKKYNYPYNKSKHVFIFDVFNKELHENIFDGYFVNNNSHPIRDLEKNDYTEVISPGECLIWSKKGTYYIVFRDVLSFSISIKKKNRKYTRMSDESYERLITDFNFF